MVDRRKSKHNNITKKISIIYSMQGLYVILTGFALIFTNLGTREKGTLSAYSIFNKGYKKLMG